MSISDAYAPATPGTKTPSQSRSMDAHILTTSIHKHHTPSSTMPLQGVDGKLMVALQGESKPESVTITNVFMKRHSLNVINLNPAKRYASARNARTTSI